MNPEPTILSELENYLQTEKLTATKFALRCGMHSGTLSNLLNGNRPMSVQQLDCITAAMEQPEGHYYRLFVDNYIIDASPDWRRTGPLLKRCAELDNIPLVQRIVNHTMDNLTYLPLLFELAEELFQQGYQAAAAVIFECVAEGERLQHSERLALCRFRLFQIALNDNQKNNLDAISQFEPYVERLDEIDQLDALKLLIDVYDSLHRWDKSEYYAEQLERKAFAQYQFVHRKNVLPPKRPIRQLIFYVLYSYLIRTQVWEERGDFEKALYYNSLASDFTWIRTPYTDAEALVIEQFKEWNTANAYLFRMKSGEVNLIPEYLKYIENVEYEITPALFHITQVANRFELNIDDILQRFSNRSIYHDLLCRIGGSNSQIRDDKNTRFLAELAVYHLRLERYDLGFEYLQQSFESSVRTHSKDNMIRCVGLFERYRSLASPEHKQKFFADNFLSYDSWFWGGK